MPPRLAVFAIVAAWLTALGWLAFEKWLPWLRSGTEPAFALDLADEVAPQHATWIVYRKDKRIGSAETRMAPKKDGTFELTSRMRDLNLKIGPVEIRIPLFLTTRTVNRDGELIGLNARTLIQFSGVGVDMKADATLECRVVGDQLVGECEFDSGSGKTVAPIEPIPLVSKAAYSPFQPLQKFPPLRPGQAWRAANVDPVSDALKVVMQQVLKKELGFAVPFPDQPKELLARVEDETEVIENRGKAYTCWVIVYRARGISAKTWVDIADGKVIRQEASGLGEALIMQRD